MMQVTIATTRFSSTPNPKMMVQPMVPGTSVSMTRPISRRRDGARVDALLDALFGALDGALVDGLVGGMRGTLAVAVPGRVVVGR